jgi:DNA polymerase I-like protein with 3'-5' exonuclease and polymerase domains
MATITMEETMKTQRKYVADPNQLPLFLPDSAWKPTPASEWPDFRGRAKIIGTDTETHDPYLKEQGPGFIRGDAYLCGVSLASEDGQKLYLPLRHSEDNVEDVVLALDYVKYQLGGDQEKCGAQLMYDMESLWSEGIEIKGPLADIQIAGPILDEERPGGFSLEALARDYLHIGKNEKLLREAASAYGVDPKKGMAILPGRFVGPYAEEDATLPIQIYLKQIEELKADEVWDIFQLERRLQRTLFKMRLKGVRIDMEENERCRIALTTKENILYDRIRELAGNINPASSDDVAVALERLGMDIPTTNKGNNSITNEWLADQEGELPSTLFQWRKTNKFRKDFVENLADESVNGRVYSQWHQLREIDSDGNKGTKGTRTGRIASSKVNLTQIPSRDPELGPMIRGMFIPDEGALWGKGDYSQQEPRHTLDIAFRLNLPGAAAARQRYIDDPATDYHQMVRDLILERTGKDIGRRNAKDINLGSTYGMGKDKLARKLGVTVEMATQILATYHAGVPYVKKLESKCIAAANERGYIRTILKRRRRFLDWEPAYGHGHGAPIRDRAMAESLYGQVRRAFVRKALNSYAQGSSADQMKKALIDLDDAGLCPQIQVYDEVDGSYADAATMRVVKQIMEQAVTCSIPFLVEPELGTSWANLEAVA